MMMLNSRTGSPIPKNPLRGPLGARCFTFSGFGPNAATGESAEQLKERLLPLEQRCLVQL
jgi:hypothetical protein